MIPILLNGHERPLAQVKFNRDGDLIFSVSKDYWICVWYSHNGERLGTYHGHQGSIWSIDVDPTTTILASGAADNTIRLWDVRTGKMLHHWEFESSIKRVEFSPDGSQLLGVTERRAKALSSILVFDVACDVDAEQAPEHSLQIVAEGPKFTVAGFTAGAKEIIACHEDGSLTKYDAKTGDMLLEVAVHNPKDGYINDMQWSADRSYFITASRDKTAKLISSHDLSVLKTYTADTPINSATITPVKDYVILGGGQAAAEVTTTATRQGKFEARFFHKIFEDEIGRVRGHFGPLNYISVSPNGRSYCSGSEDGYVRLHQFDRAYFDFLYEVECRNVNTAADLEALRTWVRPV